MNQTVTLPFFIRKSKRKLRALLCFCLQKKRRTTTMNFKRKRENVYQTRKLKVTNIIPLFSSKNDRRGIPFLSFNRIQTKSNKNQAARTCTNLNFIPNQLEENLTTSKVYLESFLLHTTSSKARTQCFLSDLRIALVLNNRQH